MKLTLSSKGQLVQLVIPAPIRRKYRLRARSKVELEERDGELFIRPAHSSSGTIPPIDYLPPGAIKFSDRDDALDKLSGVDADPDDRYHSCSTSGGRA